MEKISNYKYLGLFLICLSTLMLELILLRIFAVSLWWHFAFVSISLALFGIGTSGIAVYLFPHIFPKEKLDRQLTLCALLFALSIIFAFSTFLGIPLIIRKSFAALMSFTLIYSSLAIPFFFAGLCVSLILKHYAKKVAKFYFFDLLGAGIGCSLVVFFLFIFDAPSIVILIATFVSIGALLFCLSDPERRYLRTSVALSLSLFLFFMINLKVAKVFRIDFVGGMIEKPLYVKWNPINRIALFPIRQGEVELISIKMDTFADTPMALFDGDFEKIKSFVDQEYAFVYHLKNNAKVLIIGPGGGRDVIAALTTNQKEITAVEINPTIVDVVKNRYRNLNGDIYNHPKVKVIVDEGRSFVKRSREKYDILNLALVDTLAASLAGALAFNEMNLYTVESFIDYFKHLKKDGILCISRFRKTGPESDALRLTSITLESLKRLGINNPQNHIVIVGKSVEEEDLRVPVKTGRFLTDTFFAEGAWALRTLLVKESPFSSEDLKTIQKACRHFNTDILYSPFTTTSNVYSNLINSKDPDEFYQRYPLNITPTTDDKPFFFHYNKPIDYLHGKFELYTFTVIPALMLEALLVVILTMTLVAILLPLWLIKRLELYSAPFKGTFIPYFLFLGLGFVLIEISLMEKFILFLGKSFYAISVILSSLLVFAGIGSHLSGKIKEDILTQRLSFILLSIPMLLILYLLFLLSILDMFLSYSLFIRFLISLILMIPIGIVLGMPFPSGIRLAERKSKDLIPWLWGINGAGSVLASVISWIIVLNFGFNMALFAGLIIYLFAFGTIYLNRGKLASS